MIPNIHRTIATVMISLLLLTCKSGGVSFDVMVSDNKVALMIATATILFTCKQDSFNMLQFLSSMISISSAMYFLAKWSFDFPTLTATEMASNYWSVLLLSGITFAVSRRKCPKQLEEQSDAK